MIFRTEMSKIVNINYQDIFNNILVISKPKKHIISVFGRSANPPEIQLDFFCKNGWQVHSSLKLAISA